MGKRRSRLPRPRNLVNTISVDVDSLSLGKHTVKVVVSDGQGGTATRTWTFTRTNSAPTISGSDGNLGDKNLGFTYAYTIDDADGDTLTVVEELNDRDDSHDQQCAQGRGADRDDHLREALCAGA